MSDVDKSCQLMFAKISRGIRKRKYRLADYFNRHYVVLKDGTRLCYREDSHFKRPFGVEGEVSNGRPIKLGFLIAGLG